MDSTVAGKAHSSQKDDSNKCVPIVRTSPDDSRTIYPHSEAATKANMPAGTKWESQKKKVANAIKDRTMLWGYYWSKTSVDGERLADSGEDVEDNWRQITVDTLPAGTANVESYAVHKLGYIKNVADSASTTSGYLTKDGYKAHQFPVVGGGRKYKTALMHRLVAFTFLDIPADADRDDMIVNHKDGDKTNNDVTNLEMYTHSDTVSKSYATGVHAKSIKISQYDLEGNLVKEHSSVSAANRHIGLRPTSKRITSHIKKQEGDEKAFENYIWRMA